MSQVVNMRYPKEFLKCIDEFKEKKGFTTRTQTIIHLPPTHWTAPYTFLEVGVFSPIYDKIVFLNSKNRRMIYLLILINWLFTLR